MYSLFPLMKMRIITADITAAANAMYTDNSFRREIFMVTVIAKLMRKTPKP